MEMGREFQALLDHQVLKIDRTFAILRVSRKHPLSKDRLIISVKGSTIMSILSLIILIGILSTPEAL